MQVTIPDDLARSAGVDESEALAELAAGLYQRERLTMEQASRLARMDRMSFLSFLAARGVALTLDVDDLEHDVATLQRLRRL